MNLTVFIMIQQMVSTSNGFKFYDSLIIKQPYLVIIKGKNRVKYLLFWLESIEPEFRSIIATKSYFNRLNPPN